MSKRQVTCFNQFQLTSYKRSGSKELSNLWAPHGSTHTWNTLDSSRMLNSERHEAGGHVHDVIHKHIGREAALEQLAKDAIDGGHRGQGHIEQGKLQDETGAQVKFRGQWYQPRISLTAATEGRGTLNIRTA
eukprot:scaffold19588_cov18-Tisochrysis_lutea.AAC.2